MDPNFNCPKKHFERFESTYGAPIIVWNLVKKDGNEARLGDLYSEYFGYKVR
jgi:hypothetical protein